MSEWPMVKLGEVADFINGAAFKPTDWSSEGRPIIRIQNLTNPNSPFNRTERKVKDLLYVDPGDLLVSWSATLGVFRWTGQERAVLNQHIFKVVPKSIDNVYLEFGLRFALQQIEKYLHGATMRHINRKEFLNLTVPLPPLGEQKRIAKILGTINNSIEKLKEQIHSIESLPKKIFEQNFNREYRERKRQLVPISDFIFNTQYGTSKKASNSGAIPMLRMGNITYSGQVDMSDLKYVDLKDREIDKFTLKDGDILFNRTNSVELVGKTAVFQADLGQTISYAGYLIRARANTTSNPYYIAGYLNSPSGKAQLRLRAKAIVGMANINAREFLSLRIPSANKTEQDDFAMFYLQCESTRKLFTQKLTLLQELRRSLSARAFAGDL